MKNIGITPVDDFVILEWEDDFVVAEYRATASSMAEAGQICRRLQRERDGDDGTFRDPMLSYRRQRWWHKYFCGNPQSSPEPSTLHES